MIITLDGIFLDWLRINEKFVREIYNLINDENFQNMLPLFDYLLKQKWIEYARQN